MLNTKSEIKFWLNLHDIDESQFLINDDLSVDFIKSIYIQKANIKKLPFICNLCSDSLFVSDSKLESLEGFPKVINGNFDISRNNLTSLKYCPEIIKGDFNCEYNKLTSLEYFPKEISGDCIINFGSLDVILKNNPNLKSLGGLDIKKIKGDIVVSDKLKKDIIYQQYLLRKKMREMI